MQPNLFRSFGLLNSCEKQALLALEAPLQTRLKQLLLSSDIHMCKIVQNTLHIVQNTKRSEVRDRFLLNLLSIPNNESIKKIKEIVKKGTFEDFLFSIESKKKEYFSSLTLTDKVNTFHNQLENNLNPSHVKIYEELQNCVCYYQLPKLAEKYTQAIQCIPNASNLSLSQDFLFLFQTLNEGAWEECEKINVSKAIFRLVHEAIDGKGSSYSSNDLSEFIDAASQLKKKGGEELLDFFFTSIKASSQPTIEKMILGLRLLNTLCSEKNFYHFLKEWQNAQLKWEKLFELTEKFQSKKGIDPALFQENIPQLLKRFENDPVVSLPLSKEDLHLIREYYQKINHLCQEKQHLTFQQLMAEAHQIRAKGNTQKDDIVHLIAIGRLALRLKTGIYAYPTQILALLGILVRGESRQAQVKTGEGKSTIVTLWAFVMAMQGRTVDIITSARYLAIRDQKKYASFFEKCDITTSHICYDNKQPEHFRAQILYAPAFDFEFAWMEDRLWNTNYFKERLAVPFVSRNFDAVCVDESDNLLIDTALNGARLAYSAETSYDWIYAPILSYVVKSVFFNQLSVESLRTYLCHKVRPEQQALCLKISDEQMQVWLSSALVALNKKENIDYVIRQDKKGENRSIQIIDDQTSRLSENSRWSNGIHEFLEVKHDITVEQESITPISLSHSVFYGLYRTITALTGTAENWQTKQIYKINTFHVPPHLPLIRKDLPPVLASNREHYLALIIDAARTCTQMKRPLLILCETIQDSLYLKEKLQENNFISQLLNEIQEEEEETIVLQAGHPGTITIATSVAGRGTDIILHRESIQNGGLHVLLTFFPDSEREHEQAIGRAGRQGQPGSSQMILNKESKKIQSLIKACEEIRRLLYLFLNDDALIPCFYLLRKNKEEDQIKYYVARANLEHYLSQKTDQFFERLQQWTSCVNSDSFLAEQSQRLCKLKLTEAKKNTLHCEMIEKEKDRLLAEECKHLLTSKECDELAWKVFLKSIVESIRHQLITNWSLSFFQPAETLIKKFKGTENTIKSDLDTCFGSHKGSWERYLDLKGMGIFVYLEGITSLKLGPKL